MDKIAQFQKNLVTTINSYKSSVPKGYNKTEAMEHMEKLRLIFRLAQDLEYPSVRSIARAFNTTTTTLYKEYEKIYGHKYVKGLGKYEIAIRNRGESGLPQVHDK
jgi:DNA-binding transcriptional regulator YhcF (GntR family)